jgi:anti-sigma factor RsiW
MTERLRKFSLTRRHPPSQRLSEYLDGDLASRDRRALEAHVRDCGRCRRLLESLAATVDALGSIRSGAPGGLADSVIAELRARDQPALAVVRTASQPAIGNGRVERVRSALAFCCRRPQLRVTVPLALLVGVALSFANQGGMLLDGRIDLGMCVMCATDFVVPFVALNIVLLTIVRAPRRGRM